MRNLSGQVGKIVKLISYFFDGNYYYRYEAASSQRWWTMYPLEVVKYCKNCGKSRNIQFTHRTIDFERQETSIYELEVVGVKVLTETFVI